MSLKEKRNVTSDDSLGRCSSDSSTFHEDPPSVAAPRIPWILQRSSLRLPGVLQVSLHPLAKGFLFKFVSTFRIAERDLQFSSSQTFLGGYFLNEDDSWCFLTDKWVFKEQASAVSCRRYLGQANKNAWRQKRMIFLVPECPLFFKERRILSNNKRAKALDIFGMLNFLGHTDGVF